MSEVMNIAILDYDNTLSEGYSRYELGYLMESEGLIAKGLKEEVEALEESYQRGEIDYNTKFRDDKEIFARYYKGVSRIESSRFVREFLDLEGSLFEWSLDLINMLKSHNYLTVILSGSWDFILEEAQEILQFDTFWGSEFEVEDGKFTGKFEQIVDENVKRTVAKQLVQGAEHTVGVGDSQADLEILEVVADPFLIDPNPLLLEDPRIAGIKVVNSANILSEVEKTLKEL